MNTVAQHTTPAVAPIGLSQNIIHRYRVKPVDLGAADQVDGGTLLEWVAKAAHATAEQWSGCHCVAASVGNFHLDRPIGVGELVELHADLVYTGRSTVHILVTVRSSDPARAKAVQTSQCPIVFVAVDDTGHPTEVPRWTPVTMLELQRQRQARVRIRMRTRIESAMAAQTYTALGTAPRTTVRFRAAKTDADGSGRVRGGRVIRWIDEAAYACGADWTGSEVITSYVSAIRFVRPIVVSDVVDVTARVIYTGPRSVHISVHVGTADMDGGPPRLLAHALIVVASLDERGRARSVPVWKPASAEDQRLERHARQLIDLRQFAEPFTTVLT